MYNLLVILIIVAAVLMIGIVLIQESKGGGLSSSFASYNQIGGVRKTTDFIEKATWSLAVVMVVISVACAYTTPEAQKGSVMEGVENPVTNSNNVQGMPANPVQGQQPAANQAAPAAAQTATEAPATPAQPAK